MPKTPFTIAVVTSGLIALGIVAGGAIPSDESGLPVGSEPLPATTPARADSPDTATIRGSVVDSLGQPVVGARVSLSSPLSAGPAQPSTRTKVDGRYELNLPEARLSQWMSRQILVSLVATAPGSGMGWTRVDNPQADGEIRLVPEGPPIRGRILDQAGEPVAGVRISTQAVAVPRSSSLDESPEAAMSRYLGRPEGRILGTETESFHVPLLAMTAADGWFTLRGVGAERIATLQLAGPTIATTLVDVMTRGGPEPKLIHQGGGGGWEDYHLLPAEFALTVEPTRIIEGVVRDADSAQPLVGWRVTGSFQESIPYRFGATEARTDAEGRYRLVSLPPVDQYSIGFAPPRGLPYLEASFGLKARPGPEPVHLNRSFRKAMLVRGRITDQATGQPVPGVVQIMRFPGDPAPAEYPEFGTNGKATYGLINPDGRYEVVAPPGRSLIAFAAHQAERYRAGLGAEELPGYDDASKMIVARKVGLAGIGPMIATANFNVLAALDLDPTAPTATLDLQVESEPTVELLVLDPEGNPLGDVEIQGISRQLNRVVWHEESQVTLLNFPPASSRRVAVWHRGRRLAGSKLVAADDGPAQTIQLAPWGEVRGRLVGADGTPVGNAQLVSGPQFRRQPRVEPVGSIPPGGGRRSLRTDPGGRFHVIGLIPGLHYGLSMLDHGTALDGDLFTDLVVAPGEVKDLGDVRAVQEN